MKPSAVILPLVICAALLTGCVPTTPPDDSPETATPSPTGTATVPPAEVSLPDLSGSEVLIITATATAPSGESLDVALTVYVPVETGTAEAQQIDAWLTAQGDTSGVLAAAKSGGGVLQLMDLDVTAGSGTWPDSSGVLPVFGADQTDTIVGVPHAPLNGSLRESLTGPGEGHVVAAISPATVFDWPERFIFYGFFDDVDGVTLSNCEIKQTAKADDYPAIGSWGTDVCTMGIGD